MTTLPSTVMTDARGLAVVAPRGALHRNDSLKGGCCMLRPVNKTDHMSQDIKVLTKHWIKV